MRQFDLRSQQRGYCKKDYKDEINNNFEQYKKTRGNKDETTKDEMNSKNEINSKNETPIGNKKNIDYKKEEFLEEFLLLHNDIYFNPYKILDIDKDYTSETLKTQYKAQALIHHPDKGGDSDLFTDITKAYIYLLKKYKENIPDKQIYEMKDEFTNYVNNEKQTENILMNKSKFDLDKFNKIYDNNVTQKNNGYDNFFKDINKQKQSTYIFSEKFNIKIFNKLFENNINQPPSSQKVQVYKEPETIFQSTNGYSELGIEDIDDYTCGFNFNNKINYTDCKRAYSEPEKIDCVTETYDTIDDLKSHRSKITYNMNEDDNVKYNEYIEYEKNKELNRKKKLEKTDINILKQYNKINKLLINK